MEGQGSGVLTLAGDRATQISSPWPPRQAPPEGVSCAKHSWFPCLLLRNITGREVESAGLLLWLLSPKGAASPLAPGHVPCSPKDLGQRTGKDMGGLPKTCQGRMCAQRLGAGCDETSGSDQLRLRISKLILPLP